MRNDRQVYLMALRRYGNLIKTASGSERGSINRPIDGTTLATARYADYGAYLNMSKNFPSS